MLWGYCCERAPAAASLEDAAAGRNRIVQAVGNLTLVNGKLNPTLSNGSWAIARRELAKHGVLHVNKELLEKAADSWDEESIGERGNRLADLVISVWAGPTS